MVYSGLLAEAGSDKSNLLQAIITQKLTMFVLLSLVGLYTLYHYAFVLGWQLVFLATVAWGRGRGERAARGVFGRGA